MYLYNYYFCYVVSPPIVFGSRSVFFVISFYSSLFDVLCYSPIPCTGPGTIINHNELFELGVMGGEREPLLLAWIMHLVLEPGGASALPQGTMLSRRSARWSQ